jgi:hypothetical protein
VETICIRSLRSLCDMPTYGTLYRAIKFTEPILPGIFFLQLPLLVIVVNSASEDIIGTVSYRVPY